jgi:hypothetical protein
MTTIDNKNKSKAQRFYEFNQNERITADYTNKQGYKIAMAYNLNHPYPRHDNMFKSTWYVSPNPLPYPNTNHAGLKKSHYVPEQGRYKIGLNEPNDSRQKYSYASLVFTKSHIPNGYM